MAQTRSGCSSEKREDRDQRTIHPALLYPPSYFSSRVAALPAEVSSPPPAAGDGNSSEDDSHSSGGDTYIVSRQSSKTPPQQNRADTARERQKVAALKIENESLRYQLQNSARMMLPPTVSHNSPIVLTSELLQVERDLMGRVAQLEAECKRYSQQLAAADASVREERDCHFRDRSNITAQHQLELERLNREKVETEERLKSQCDDLTAELAAAREKEEERGRELELANEELAHSTEEKLELSEQLEREKKSNEDQISSLQIQLDEEESKKRAVQEELAKARDQVSRLESYLGGELPDKGVTWREEKQTLLERIKEGGEGRERREEEMKLLSLRLGAISDILSLQEKTLKQGKVRKESRESVGANGHGEGNKNVAPGERGGGERGSWKNILTLWREKVFALLVEARLSEISQNKDIQELQIKVSEAEAKRSEALVERDLAVHTITDRTAQLQLLSTRNEELGRRVEMAEVAQVACRKESEQLSSNLRLVVSESREKCSQLKCCLDGCFTRLTSFNQRLGVACNQLSALKERKEREEEAIILSLRAENQNLQEELVAVRTELESFRESETQLQSVQASLQTRIDQAVMEERRKGRQELREAQELLEVARREQAKTALQLQRSGKKLEEERAAAVEAAEVARQGVEEELQRCRERLRAVQVERNLLLTTLREEGIVSSNYHRHNGPHHSYQHHEEIAHPPTGTTQASSSHHDLVLSTIANCSPGYVNQAQPKSLENGGTSEPKSLENGETPEPISNSKHPLLYTSTSQELETANRTLQLPTNHPIELKHTENNIPQQFISRENQYGACGRSSMHPSDDPEGEEDITKVLKELQTLSTALLNQS